MLFIAGISIAVFVTALLLFKKDKSTSDIFLLLWMVLNVAHLGFYYLIYSNIQYDYPHLLGIQLPFPLLQGVFLYYYVSTVTNQAPKEKWKYLLHLIPAFLTYAYLISFYLRPAAEKIDIFKNEGGEEYAGFMGILMMAVFLSGIIYVIWCSYLLYKHKQNIRSQFSDLEEINLSWLQFLVVGLGIVWSLVIFTQSDSIIYIGVAIFVILVGFFGVQQKNIFSSNSLNQEKQLASKGLQPKEPVTEKYKSSGLSDEHADEHFRKLDQLMKQEKFYKNASMSLGDLADQLDLHPNYLSQIINDKGGKSFYDYVNTFRVNEFKKLLEESDSQKYTLMALAYESGFNSKSSFNRYFKKMTGKTPSQYANR